jgi:hypothetical protein
MAAPTNAALLDYEGNIEDAVATYLAASLASTQILTSRTILSTSGTLSTPRVTVSVQVGGTNPNQQNNRTTDGGEYDSHKLATLSLDCTVRRDASGQSLGTLRGSVRVAMLQATAALTAVNLPYYQIITLRESASAMASDAVNDEISHTLSYQLEFFIKPDQWAAS